MRCEASAPVTNAITTNAANGPSEAGGRRCAICGKPAVAEFRAFCSRRCADVDLNRWLSGVYVVPGKAEETEDESAAPEQGGGES
jgi:uncharacterized protein